MKKFLKKININNFIYLLIISICVSQVVKFYTYYQEYSAWQYSDWVINYQGGFIRRGFIGEILFNLYSLTNINLDLIVLFFVIEVISVFKLQRGLKENISNAEASASKTSGHANEL